MLVLVTLRGLKFGVMEKKDCVGNHRDGVINFDMIVTNNNIKGIPVKDRQAAIILFKYKCDVKNEQLIYIAEKKNYIPSFSRYLLEMCDKCIVYEFEEAKFSSWNIVKDRNPDRKIDDELLVHFGLAFRTF